MYLFVKTFPGQKDQFSFKRRSEISSSGGRKQVEFVSMLQHNPFLNLSKFMQIR